MSENKSCILCGKCLQNCNYYKENRTEELSPRGRIVLCEEPGEQPMVYCTGCMNCFTSCPFELSPVLKEKKVFKWENVQLDDAPLMLKDIFNLIYDFDNFNIDCSKIEIKDETVHTWLTKRGVSHIYNRELITGFANNRTVIFNPFTDMQQNEDVVAKWNDILQ